MKKSFARFFHFFVSLPFTVYSLPFLALRRCSGEQSSESRLLYIVPVRSSLLACSVGLKNVKVRVNVKVPVPVPVNVPVKVNLAPVQ